MKLEQLQQDFPRLELIHTGGNCTAWMLPLSDDPEPVHLLITDSGDPVAPNSRTRRVDVGTYRAGGVWELSDDARQRAEMGPLAGLPIASLPAVLRLAVSMAEVFAKGAA